jgi:hypothetical protein
MSFLSNYMNCWRLLCYEGPWWWHVCLVASRVLKDMVSSIRLVAYSTSFNSWCMFNDELFWVVSSLPDVSWYRTFLSTLYGQEYISNTALIFSCQLLRCICQAMNRSCPWQFFTRAGAISVIGEPSTHSRQFIGSDIICSAPLLLTNPFIDITSPPGETRAEILHHQAAIINVVQFKSEDIISNNKLVALSICHADWQSRSLDDECASLGSQIILCPSPRLAFENDVDNSCVRLLRLFSKYPHDL